MSEDFSIRSSSTEASDGIVIVPMSAEMVGPAANIHLQALAGSRTAIMGEAYVRAFIDWFRHAEGGVALAAIDTNGGVLGYVIGAPLGYPQALSQELTWRAARAVFVRPWLIFRQQFRDGFLGRLGLVLGRSQSQGAAPDLPAPTISLVAMGVAGSVRGRKIGVRLVRGFETSAQELQMRSLRLSTRSDNVAACRLYERCGWRAFPAAEGRTYYFRIPAERSDARER